MGVRIESKNPSSIFANSVLDVLISSLNKMNSFSYNSSHFFPSECFASNKDENEETIQKQLIKVVKDDEDRTSIIEDIVIINLGTIEEHVEIKIEKSLTLEEQEEFILILKEFINVFYLVLQRHARNRSRYC